MAMTAKPSGTILRLPDPASGDRTPPRVFDPFDPDPRILDPYPGATSSREESAETWIQGEIESIYDRADPCLIPNDGETLSPTQHRLLLLAGLAQRTTKLKPDPLYTLEFCIRASPIDAATPIARPPAGPVCDGRRLTIGTVRRHLRYLEGQGMLKLLACSVPQSADPYDEIGDQTLAIIDFRPLLKRGDEIELQVAKYARASEAFTRSEMPMICGIYTAASISRSTCYRSTAVRRTSPSCSGTCCQDRGHPVRCRSRLNQMAA
jgi:hypothetical protein